jgi:hypothetical protein
MIGDNEVKDSRGVRLLSKISLYDVYRVDTSGPLARTPFFLSNDVMCSFFATSFTAEGVVSIDVVFMMATCVQGVLFG